MTSHTTGPSRAPEKLEDQEQLDSDTGSMFSGKDLTHRKLKSRHIQLIGIGGTIGTALYVQIGHGLIQGGPASLILAFAIWCMFILMITVSMAEMVTYLPISSPFIRFAGRYVDEAFGFAAGWNFFVFEAALVPFEIVACNVILHYWTTAVPTAVVIAVVIASYALLNLLAVKWYGESEFWCALAKALLAIVLIVFTFFAMVGVNPIHDKFGFRYWRNPGAFAEFYAKGDLGRFMGFIAALTQASFTIAGPDYVSMAAGEAENPRTVMPRAFKAVFMRLTFFFIMGSLAVGILVPYNDPTLIAAFENDKPGAAASPYVVAMTRLRISVLPDIINAVVLSAAFSAGNSYVYCASRSLYGMALDGKAPKIFTKVNRSGVPIYCVALVLAIALLSFLQLSRSSAVVLTWFVRLVTASQLINFCVMSVTYIGFYRALKAQGFDRRQLRFRSWFQPYIAYISFAACFVMAFIGGYTVFLPGNWDLPSFLFSYTMIVIFPILFLGYKMIKRSKFHRPAEIDLNPPELRQIIAYEESYVPVKSKSPFVRALDYLFG